MSYHVNLKGGLSFASTADKQKFIDILKNSEDFRKHYSSIEEFIENEIAFDCDKDGDLVYEFYDSDRRYNEQDDSFIMILKEGEIDADFVIEFTGEDGACWRTTYNKEDKEHTENKVYLSEALVHCKDCQYCSVTKNGPTRHKCHHWSKIAGGKAAIFMDKNDYCSYGVRRQSDNKSDQNAFALCFTNATD